LLNETLYEECISKFVDSYIICPNCKAAEGMIYSNVMENGEIRRPYKNCLKCNHWCWLETAKNELIDTGSLDEEMTPSISSSFTSSNEQSFIKEKTEEEEEIERILDMVLLDKEIRGFSLAYDCDLIIVFLNKLLSDKKYACNTDNDVIKTEIWANEILRTLDFWINKFTNNDLNIKKYRNYIIFHTLLKGLKNPKKMVVIAGSIIRKVFFDDEDKEQQTELLLLIVDL